MITSILKGLLVILIAYALGSISFAYIITKLKTGNDIRTMGSGNAGFTNCLRVLPKPLAFLVFFLDLAKGYVATWIGLAILGPTGGILGCVMSIIGHTFPFWLGFRGGKGIATGFGGLLALVPAIAWILLAIWAVVVVISNYISLGSVAAAVAMPILAFIFQVPVLYFVLFLLCAILVVYKHRGNISRIRQGTESKLFKGR